MKVHDVCQSALSGWKGKFADVAAQRVPMRDDYVRAAFGFFFLAL